MRHRRHWGNRLMWPTSMGKRRHRLPMPEMDAAQAVWHVLQFLTVLTIGAAVGTDLARPVVASAAAPDAGPSAASDDDQRNHRMHRADVQAYSVVGCRGEWTQLRAAAAPGRIERHIDRRGWQ